MNLTNRHEGRWAVPVFSPLLCKVACNDSRPRCDPTSLRPLGLSRARER